MQNRPACDLNRSLHHYRLPLVLLLLYIHITIVSVGAFRNGPAWDEVGHLVAGVEHWDEGTFQLYKVNPPLAQTVAAFPLLFIDHAPLQIESGAPFYGRPEWTTGKNFVEANGQQVFTHFAFARMALLPFSVLGALVCLWWAEELFGTTAGLAAMSCWCLGPTMSANAQLMTPDLTATAMGLYATWRFRRWVLQPSWRLAAAAGLMFGLTLLSKTTWLVLFGVLPVIWLIARRSLDTSDRRFGIELVQLTCIFVIAIYIVNLGYAFDGSLRPLGEYRFVSAPLRGQPFSEWETYPVGNMFLGTPLESIPVPLPASFVEGIDFQKEEFASNYWSYFAGVHRRRGWWCFYADALLWKIPIGFLLMGFVATLEWFRHPEMRSFREALFLLPGMAVLLLVSSQTGFSHHVRYVLPFVPFFFIWASRSVLVLARGYNWRSLVTACGFAWAVSSSLCSAPNHLSYFNGFVGGTANAHRFLGMGPMDTTLEWGQDLLELSRWVSETPYVTGLDGVAFGGLGQVRQAAGLTGAWPPPARSPLGNDLDVCRLGPRPGWYAVGIKDVYNETSDFHYFSLLRPRTKIGDTIYVYFVTEHDADQLWKQMYGEHSGRLSRQHCWWRMNPVPLEPDNDEAATAESEQE